LFLSATMRRMKKLIILSVATLLGIMGVLLTESSIGGKKVNTAIQEFQPQMERQVRQLTTRIVATPTPSSTPIPLSSDQFINIINSQRKTNQVNELKLGKQTCAVLHMYANKQSLRPADIRSACPTCGSLNIFSFGQPVSQNSLMELATQDASISAIFTDKALTHACAENVDEAILLATVEIYKSPPPAAVPKEISEEELWQAMTEYRRDHKVPDLTRDENLCTYARKRVQDQLSLYAEKKPAESYPVPTKYPLDAHNGFQKDADNGFVFEVTKRSMVAENLAYWPTATFAVHVIEWGWDTSTEGHKEAQLSTEYTAGCLSGKQGFFVAIFAK